MMSKLRTGLIVTLATLSLVSCKSSTDGKSEYIDHISIQKGEVAFNYTTTFSSSVEMDLEGEFPVGKYGSIYFGSDAKGRLNVSFAAQLNLWNDINLTPAATLPNGAKFPLIVSGPMKSLLVNENPGKYKIYAYVDSLDAISKIKLAGLAIELEGLKNNIPQISITQSFYNGESKVASFTIYGPRTVNGVTKPGGLFLVGDINQAFNGETLYADKVFVHGPQSKEYSSDEAKRQLAIKMQKALEANGIRVKMNY